MSYHILVQEDNFNLEQELALLENQQHDAGALVSFIGKVRGLDDPQRQLSHLFLTHLPIATEQEIEKIIQQAIKRWSLAYVKVIHRIGQLNVGEQIVLVLTASSHRHDAYEANRFIMDYLKIEAPFWKKECFTNGEEHWVDMKQSDYNQFKAWQ